MSDAGDQTRKPSRGVQTWSVLIVRGSAEYALCQHMMGKVDHWPFDARLWNVASHVFYISSATIESNGVNGILSQILRPFPIMARQHPFALILQHALLFSRWALVQMMQFAISVSLETGDGDWSQNPEPARCASVPWSTISDFDLFQGFFGGETLY